MKRSIIIAICAVFAVAALPGQNTAKTDSKAAGLGKPETVSNEDANIRAYIELLRTDLRQAKSEVVGEVMRLNSDQAVKFWPIYKEFESEYQKLGDQIAALVKKYSDEYGQITDAVAAQLGNQALSIEDQRNALKKKYYDRLIASVGAITATRFLQVENQLERLVDLQMAAQLPIIGER